MRLMLAYGVAVATLFGWQQQVDVLAAARDVPHVTRRTLRHDTGGANYIAANKHRNNLEKQHSSREERALQETRPPIATRPPIPIPGVTRPPVGEVAEPTSTPSTQIPTFSPTVSPTPPPELVEEEMPTAPPDSSSTESSGGPTLEICPEESAAFSACMDPSDIDPFLECSNCGVEALGEDPVNFDADEYCALWNACVDEKCSEECQDPVNALQVCTMNEMAGFELDCSEREGTGEPTQPPVGEIEPTPPPEETDEDECPEPTAELEIVVGATEPLGNCQSDCTEVGCQEGLTCFKVDSNGPSEVPGCSGSPQDEEDYCAIVPDNYLNFITDEPESGSLNRCEGNCDSDDDCVEGLVCSQRNSRSHEDEEPVPGCCGKGRSGSEYCYDPADAPATDPPAEVVESGIPTFSPTVSPTSLAAPPSTPTPDGECVDQPDWSDSDGDGCDWYEDNEPAGCPDRGDLTDEDGTTANEACCHCQIEVDETEEPTPSPVEEEFTPFPTSPDPPTEDTPEPTPEPTPSPVESEPGSTPYPTEVVSLIPDPTPTTMAPTVSHSPTRNITSPIFSKSSKASTKSGKGYKETESRPSGKSGKAKAGKIQGKSAKAKGSKGYHLYNLDRLSDAQNGANVSSGKSISSLGIIVGATIVMAWMNGGR